MKSFFGTGVAIVTPFKKDGSIDFNGLDNLLNHLIKGKIEYVVVLGTTGESVNLSKEEKKQLVDHVIKKVKGKLKVVVGHGGNNTEELIKGFKDYDFKHIDAILSVTPYYNKPTQKGIIAHYAAISKASPVPIILYNVPGRTAVNMLPDTTLHLAKTYKNIVAVKEASGNVEQCMKIIKDKPKDFLVISGDDAITLPLISVGAAGVISVVANAYPKEFSEMVRLGLKNKFEAANKIHYKLLEVTECLFKEGNPGGIKDLLQHKKICGDTLRLPLINISAELSNTIKKIM